FPSEMNYADEIHRFGRAGELYSQANPEKLHKVIDSMVEHHVVWDPTFSIYEASRDLQRARNQPWFKDSLHPSLEEYFKASLEHATWNGAKLLGMDDRIGKIREGFIADLLVVNGNPLENLKLLNAYGTDVMLINGKPASNYAPIGVGDRVQNVHGGGIEWTIKD